MRCGGPGQQVPPANVRDCIPQPNVPPPHPRNRHWTPFSWLHSWGHSSIGRGTHRLAEGFCILLFQNPVQHTEAALQGVPLTQAAAPLAELLHTAGQMADALSTATAEAVQAVAGLLHTARQMGRLPDVPGRSIRSCAGSCWLHTAMPGQMAQDLLHCANSEGVQAVRSCWAAAHIRARLFGHAGLTWCT